MPKRLCRGCSEHLCKNCSERFGCPREHLYLVVDDWSSGYNIRNINLSSGSGEGAVQCLPPGFMNVEAERGVSEFFTSAFGTKIMATHPNLPEFPVPIIDLDRKTILPGPETNCPAHPIYFPVGNKVYALDIGTFEVCHWQPNPTFSPLAENNWRWCQLQRPLFSRLRICSYAVNEQKQTIFVSIKGDTVATFSFDIGESMWERYGQWALPFNDRGYYDRDLDGYVGLSKDPESLGYLYFCDMTRTDTDSRLCPCPVVERSKVKVFNKNPAEIHLSATLMYMHHSKFCIVECVSVDDVKADQALHELSGTEASSGSIYMYRVITFTIRYNRRSDLKVKNYRVQCYKVPREATSELIHEDPVAFWL
ncbi:unnamed protein product [Urochloa decumbens]|uniref:DUF1618 domain-containing protein n=1 Tax=Urochloa decumbens TaxID=240449 RepID=A0ABC9CG61_9POAL